MRSIYLKRKSTKDKIHARLIYSHWVYKNINWPLYAKRLQLFYCNKSKTSISHDHISKILGSPYCFFDIIMSIPEPVRFNTIMWQQLTNHILGGGDVIIPAASSMNVPDLILMIVWIYLIRGAETNKLPLMIQKPDVPVLYIFWYCEILNLVSKYYTILYNILRVSKYITQVLIHWLMTPIVQCTITA